MTPTSQTGLLFPSPCPHCGKDNENKWCYQYFDTKNQLYAVCKRQNEPANGWETTDFKDKEGDTVYRLAREVKTRRPDGQKTWYYPNRSGHPMVRVQRVDMNGKRDFWQEHFDGKTWKKGLNGLERHHIPIYRHREVQNAISQGERIWIPEGEDKADLLWQMDLPATCNIGGSGKWRESDTNDLSGVKEVVLCPDRDEKSRKHYEQLAIELKQQLGCKILWMPASPFNFFWHHLPPDHGLDIKDWVMSGATKKDILAAVTNVSPFKPKTEPATAIDVQAKTVSNDREKKGGKAHKLTTRNLYHFIDDTYELKYNELLKVVEIDGEEYDVDEAYLDLAIEHDIKASKAIAADLFIKVAKKNKYHPIRDYLDGLHAVGPISIDNLSSRYFGTSDPLFDTFLKKTLIGAVARIYKPGSQVDSALVLQGSQGVGKSSFFRILAGDWFSCSMGAGGDRDDLLILHQKWILEWGEIEKLFGKKSAAELKPFITRPSDTFREPYARKAKEVKRSSILVGTTNKNQFLADETGNRRYWVVPIATDKIDLELLESERDGIWKAAVDAFKSGEEWHLTRDEERLNMLNNQKFSVEDTWEEAISQWLIGKQSVTVKQVLDECLSAALIDQGVKEQGRVRDILTGLGWQSGLEGKNRRRVWIAPKNIEGDQGAITHDHPTDHPPDHPPEPLPGKPLTEVTAESGDQGDHPKTKTFIFSVGDKIEVYNYKFQKWVSSEIEEVDETDGGYRYYCKGGYYCYAENVRPRQSKS